MAENGNRRAGPALGSLESFWFLDYCHNAEQAESPMHYEWDKAKAEQNFRKHGVDFADAVTVLEDEQALTFEDGDSEEPRFVSIGMDAMGRILVVVYMWRVHGARMISARKAGAREREQYEGKRP